MSMTNRDIYSSALVHLGTLASNTVCEDYEERAPYIIANFCNMSKAIDEKIRKNDGIESAPSFSGVYMFLEANFPLCEKMIAPAVFYLAAMLVIDEDPELSDKLYERYCDLMCEISMSLTYQNGKITQKYFAD